PARSGWRQPPRPKGSPLSRSGPTWARRGGPGGARSVPATGTPPWCSAGGWPPPRPEWLARTQGDEGEGAYRDEARDPAEGAGRAHAQVLRDGPHEQRAEGRHAREGQRVESHHAAA